MKKEKKEILKKYTGKGGPIIDAGVKGFGDAYKSNMAKYRAESGIDKNMFPDGVRSAMKGAAYGAIKAGQKAGEVIGSKFSKKEKLKDVVGKAAASIGAAGAAPFKTSAPMKTLGEKMALNAPKTMPKK